MATTLKTIEQRLTKIERVLFELSPEKNALVKLRVSEALLKQAKNAIFDFDIEKFASSKDIQKWK